MDFRIWILIGNTSNGALRRRGREMECPSLIGGARAPVSLARRGRGIRERGKYTFEVFAEVKRATD